MNGERCLGLGLGGMGGPGGLVGLWSQKGRIRIISGLGCLLDLHNYEVGFGTN